jgi:hypothetical protein
MNKKNDFDTFDIIETAASIEYELGIQMHLDIVFNNLMLNKYFNYDYSVSDDSLTINFEIDEGSASIEIVNALGKSHTDDIDYSFNEVLNTHIENLGRYTS